MRALGPSSAAQSVWREPVRALNRLLRRRLCFLVFSGSLERAARGRQSSTGADYTTRTSARFCSGPCLPRPAPRRTPSTMERGGLGLSAGAVGSVAGSGCHAGRLPSRVRLQPPPVVTGERPKPRQDSPPASAYTRSHAGPVLSLLQRNALQEPLAARSGLAGGRAETNRAVLSYCPVFGYKQKLTKVA